jgi:hypothetical protein
MRYLHLTSDRPPSAATQMKFLEVSMILNEKKGYPRKKIVRNFIQIYQLKFWRECLRRFLGKPHREYDMLKELLPKLKEKRDML